MESFNNLAAAPFNHHRRYVLLLRSSRHRSIAVAGSVPPLLPPSVLLRAPLLLLSPAIVRRCSDCHRRFCFFPSPSQLPSLEPKPLAASSAGCFDSVCCPAIDSAVFFASKFSDSCFDSVYTIVFSLQQFERLFQFARKIEDLVFTISAEEIPFQLGLSKMDLRKMLKSSLSGVDKSIASMYKKLQKNVMSEELLPSLWDKCKACPNIFGGPRHFTVW